MSYLLGILIGVVVYFCIAVPLVLHMKKKKKKMNDKLNQVNDDDNINQ